MDSAASLCTKALDPIDADHFDIVKPDSENSAPYIAFKAAYADAKITELRRIIDNGVSSKIAGEITEIIRFPNDGDALIPPTLLETVQMNKLPQRIFRSIEHYNRDEIQNVPKIGDALYQFKADYYDFRNAEQTWEDAATNKIGSLVEVRFRQAWIIYLQYAILRLTGNSAAQIMPNASLSC
jgi:hypothetical protein